MPDDRVMIAPEFQSSRPRVGQSRWLPLGAVAAAMLILGWLLGSSPSVQPEAMQTSTSTTALARETTTTALTRETTTTTTVAPALAGLALPLEEAVPGFEDIITLTVVSDDSPEVRVDVVRWRPSEAAPEKMVVLRNGAVGPLDTIPRLDAAGIWYALHDESGVLSVLRPGFVAVGAGSSQSAEEAVALRVADYAWHDTESGRLAWLSCPRSHVGPVTLHSLDVADLFAEPAMVVSLPFGCGASGGARIDRWGDWGFALGRLEAQGGEGPLGEVWTVLLDTTGEELAQFEQDGSYIVAAGPAGTVWTQRPTDGTPSSFVLSLDGQRRAPVPGLAEGEWIDDAWWSPDGSRIALLPASARAAHPTVRIVDAATGGTIAEIDEPDSEVRQASWSSEGRFLLYRRDRDDAEPAEARFVVYDTATAAIAAEVPVPDRLEFLEIRTDDAATAMQLTPVEWGIQFDDAGPGVHTVSMIAHVPRHARDQVEEPSGRLIWDETIVELCGIGTRGEGPDGFYIGDIFQTTEGCGANPSAMQDAFDLLGVPESACLMVTLGDYDRQYCAPLWQEPAR